MKRNQHERDCRSAPFCANHQMVGHRTDQCRNPTLGNGQGQGYKPKGYNNTNFSPKHPSHHQQHRNHGQQGNYRPNYQQNNQSRPISASSSQENRHAKMHHNNDDQYSRNNNNSSTPMSYTPSQQNFRQRSSSNHPS